MASSAFQAQYRQEAIETFEQQQSVLRDACTTEVQIKGNTAIFLNAGSGGARAVTRGLNGRIPGRDDALTQNTCTLQEYHDVPERTGWNIFASQGNGNAIMQRTSMAVMNREIDYNVIAELANATNYAGLTATTASADLALRAKAILGVAQVPFDGNIYAAITPAFEAYMLKQTEFSSADFVSKKPIDTGETTWDDKPGWYVWGGVKWIVSPLLPGIGTNAEKCFMWHKSAIGHAANVNEMQTYVGYDERHDFSYCRQSIFMGSKLLQNAGVVVFRHDGSALAATA
jgi:hypothetical protein